MTSPAAAPPAARASRARQPAHPRRTGTGATRRIETPLARPIGGATRLLVDLPPEIPIAEREVDLLLHWVGDVLAGLTGPDDAT